MNTENLETLRDVKENLNLIKTEETRKLAEKIFSTSINLDLDLDTYATFDFVVKNIDLNGEVKEMDVIFNNSFSTGTFDTGYTYRDIFEEEMDYDELIGSYIDELDYLFTLSDLNEEQENILENAKTLAKYHLKDGGNNTLLYAKVLEKDNQNYLYVDILNSYQTYQTKRNYRSEVLIKIDEDDAKELMRLIEKDDNIKICKNISELIDGKRYFYEAFKEIFELALIKNDDSLISSPIDAETEMFLDIKAQNILSNT